MFVSICHDIIFGVTQNLYEGFFHMANFMNVSHYYLLFFVRHTS